MKGYAGREAPPSERLTVGAGHTKLVKAIEQVQLADKMGAYFKTKFLRVDPEHYGVNFVTYDAYGKIKALVEIGDLPDVEINDKAFPVIYPADPFLTIPTLLLIKHPVTLVVRFKDAVAWALIASPEAGKSAAFTYRVGQIRLDEKTEQAAPVVEIPQDSFKIVSE